MTFVRNTASLLATAAFITPIRLVTVIALARMLSPEELGIYTITITFATVSMLIAQLGLPSSAIYRIRRLGYPPARVVGSVLLTGSVFGVIGIACLVIAEPLLTEMIFKEAPIEAYHLGIGIAFFQLLGASFVGVARGIDRFDLANYYQVLLSVGQLIGLLLVLGPMQGGLVGALIVVGVIHVGSSVFLIGSVIRRAGISLVDWKEQLAPGLKFGVKSHAQTLAGNLHEQIDIFMLAYLSGNASEIAIYSVAVGVITRLKLVPGALANALFPEIAGRPKEEGPALAAQMTRHSFTGVLLIAAAIALVAPIIVPAAFGAVYQNSVPILLVLIPGMVMLTNFVLLGRYFMGMDRQQVPISIQTVAVLLNVSINFMLIPLYGIMGAAIASCVSYSFECIAITFVFVRSTDQSLATCMRFTRADAKIYWSLLERIRRRFLANRGSGN